jgi:IclR family KDG regulon transcriptional repressor
MAILGIRSGLRAIILDKVNSTFEIQIVSEVGMRIPLLAGAGGKALLTQLSDEEIDKILDREDLKRYTPNSCTDKGMYKAMIQETRKKGIAVDMEEYLEGMRALGVPLNLKRRDIEAAIWVVGLKDHVKDERIDPYSELLKRTAREIENRLVM